MTVRIFFDGLGMIGASIAMALGKEKNTFERIAFDVMNERPRELKKQGAIDQVSNNGIQAAAKADIVVIDIPVDLLEEHYEYLGEVVKPNTTILDTTPVPMKVAQLAKKFIPENVAVVSFVPGMSAEHFFDHTFNHQAAHDTMFAQSSIAISSPSSSHADGESVASGLCNLLGATPMYMDAVEVQVALAKTRILPRLLSAALMQAFVDEPGWEEARVLASADFAKLSFPVMAIFEEKFPGLDAKLSDEITLRVVDEFMASLQQLRVQLAAKKAADFHESMKKAIEKRTLWYVQRQSNNFRGEPDQRLSTMGDSFHQMFLGGIGRKKQRSDDE